MIKVEIHAPTYHKERLIKRLLDLGLTFCHVIPGVLKVTKESFDVDDDVTGVFDHVIIAGYTSDDNLEKISKSLQEPIEKAGAQIFFIKMFTP